MIDGGTGVNRGECHARELRKRPQKLGPRYGRLWQSPYIDRAEERIRHLLIERSSHGQVLVWKLIRLNVCGQPSAFAAGISEINCKTISQFALDVEIPLLCIAHVHTAKENADALACQSVETLASAHQGKQSVRKWIAEPILGRDAVIERADERCNY